MKRVLSLVRKLHFSLLVLGGVSLGCSHAVEPHQTTSQQTQKPNIIVVLADDMGYSDIGVMGSEIPTPNIDSLAKEGVLFTHFYNTARCSTTRASLLTGVYAHKTGVGHLDNNLGHEAYEGFIKPNVATVAEVLSDNGYRTILSGKWHVGKAREHWPDKRGFERFYGIPAGGGLYFYPSDFIDRPIYRNNQVVTPQDPNYYTTTAFTDEAIRFINEASEDKKPFFLYLAHIAPHFPLQAPESEVERFLGQYQTSFASTRQQRFARQQASGVVSEQAHLSPLESKRTKDTAQRSDRKMAVYAAQVSILDENMGRLVHALDELNQLDNTLILFLSDNGAASSKVSRGNLSHIGGADSFVAYGPNWANVSNTPYRKYKKYVHEGGIITPLIAHWPAGITSPGRIEASPQHVIDILPTLLSVSKSEHPSDINAQTDVLPLDGQSFATLLNQNKESEHSPTESKRWLFWEHEGNRAVRFGNMKAVRTNKGPWELYDLIADPTEMEDLSMANPSLLAKMVNEYEQWERQNKVQPWPIAANSQ